MLKCYTKCGLFMKFSLRVYRTQFTVIIIVSIMPWQKPNGDEIRCTMVDVNCWRGRDEAKCDYDCGLHVVSAASLSHSMHSILLHCSCLFIYNSIKCITLEPEMHSFFYSLLVFFRILFSLVSLHHVAKTQMRFFIRFEN